MPRNAQWTTEEDEELTKLALQNVKENNGNLDWDEIHDLRSGQIARRSKNAMISRWWKIKERQEYDINDIENDINDIENDINNINGIHKTDIHYNNNGINNNNNENNNNNNNDDYNDNKNNNNINNENNENNNNDINNKNDNEIDIDNDDIDGE
eukprot:49083_1